MITALTDSFLAATAPDPEIEEMMKAGVHFGHARSRRHPSMTPFVWGVRNNVEIIDLAATKEKLKAALDFLKEAAASGKLILLVGTRPSAKELVKSTADELDYPRVSERWIGGTLTNFKVMLKRVETLEKLEEERASGAFEKYAKKEQLKKIEEINRLSRNFDGLRRLKKLPDVVVIIDPAYDSLVLKEAKRVNVAVVALADTNVDLRAIDYPIPANNDARQAVAYVLGRMKEAILSGRLAAENQPPALGEESKAEGK